MHHARKGLTPVEMTSADFKKAGHELVERIGDFINSFENRLVTRGQSPSQVKNILGEKNLPEEGDGNVTGLLNRVSEILFENSLFNSHPMFFGYITSTPTPIGILSDMLASTINPNVGAGILSPVATEIELQTIKWMAEFIGYPSDCGGVMGP